MFDTSENHSEDHSCDRRTREIIFAQVLCRVYYQAVTFSEILHKVLINNKDKFMVGLFGTFIQC